MNREYRRAVRLVQSTLCNWAQEPAAMQAGVNHSSRWPRGLELPLDRQLVRRVQCIAVWSALSAMLGLQRDMTAGTSSIDGAGEAPSSQAASSEKETVSLQERTQELSWWLSLPVVLQAA